MSRQITGVHLDPQRGHVTMTDGDDGPPVVTMTDMGGRLRLWAYESATLTPEAAWLLADALNEWADNAKNETRGGRFPGREYGGNGHSGL